MSVFFFWSLCSFILFQPTHDAQFLIDQAINFHGGKNYKKYHLSFDFRDYHFEVKNKKGQYEYIRSYEDDNGDKHRQILSNKGYLQYINGSESVPDDKTKNARSEAINSVVYFAMLPQALNDEAVIKTYVGEAQILSYNYYVVRVNFQQKNGGQDFQDEFYYWINQSDYSIDYLAYTYQVNGGGVRFRASYNPRRVSGILFQDFVNYKVEKGIDLLSLPQLYEQGSLQELSRIELKNLKSE